MSVAAVMLAGAMAMPATAPDIGQVVPDFTATTLEGKPISLGEAAAAHNAVVVLFLSTACPYAVYFADHIRELDETYRARGVAFIGVNSNQFESAADMREDARERGHVFALVRDEGAKIADVMGADRTPEAFVVGSDRTLRYRGWVKSKLRSPDLQRALDAVLAGKRVRLPETKAFGCAIDRARP